MSPMARLKRSAFLRGAMTDTLTPVEHTNWALLTWNSTLDWNDVPSACLYSQDHLWATQDLMCSPGGSLRLAPISYTAFHFLYTAPAIDRVDRHGLSNTAHR